MKRGKFKVSQCVGAPRQFRQSIGILRAVHDSCPGREVRTKRIARPIEVRAPSCFLPGNQLVWCIGPVAEQIGIAVGREHIRYFAMLGGYLVDRGIHRPGRRHSARIDDVFLRHPLGRDRLCHGTGRHR